MLLGLPSSRPFNSCHFPPPCQAVLLGGPFGPVSPREMRLIRLEHVMARRSRRSPPARPGEPKPAAESQSIGAARPREATSHRRSAVLPFAARTPIWAAGGEERAGKRKGVQLPLPLHLPPSASIEDRAARGGTFRRGWPVAFLSPPAERDRRFAAGFRAFEAGGGALRDWRFHLASTTFASGASPTQVSFRRMSPFFVLCFGSARHNDAERNTWIGGHTRIRLTTPGRGLMIQSPVGGWLPVGGRGEQVTGKEHRR